MNHRSLSEDIREGLIRQLVYFDENRFNLLDQLTFSTPSEKKEIRLLLEHYVKRIESIVAGSEEDLRQSRVLIGSKVLLRFEDGSDRECYTIVLPEDTDPDDNRISCLSPLGRALLLAARSDRVAVRTPQGDYEVTVLDNEYVFMNRMATERRQAAPLAD